MRGTRQWLIGAGRALGVLAVMTAASTAAPGLAADSSEKVSVTPTASVERLRVGEEAKIAIRLSIASGWHINSNEPGLDFLIPTSLDFELPAGLEVVAVEYPPGRVKRLELAGGRDVRLYEGEVEIGARVRYAAGGDETGTPTVVVRYQACKDTICLRPASERLPLGLRLVEDDGGASGGSAGIELVGFTVASYAQVRRSGAPFVILFSADYCAPCAEMKERTYHDERVVREARGFTFLVVDMTRPDDFIERVLDSFEVGAAPTTLFFSPGGEECTRRAGFIGPDDFVGLLSQCRHEPGAPAPGRDGLHGA